jgi:peptidoglycan/xylan/chitin deacetylase (PgdA/CDA1 family)
LAAESVAIRRDRRRWQHRVTDLVALVMLLVLLAVSAGCVSTSPHDGGSALAPQLGTGSSDPDDTTVDVTSTSTTSTTSTVATSTSTLTPTATLPPIAPAVPGPAQVISRVPGAVGRVALTFDDGFCGDCVATMVGDIERTGAHVTFCPNGTYARVWMAYIDRIRVLIAKGQLQICNHTWDHRKITGLTRAHLTDEINRNEQWIEDTFGVTGRPFFRPPYGSHNAASDAVAGSLGFTKVIMWSSTLSDSTLQPPETIIRQLETNLVPGGIVLGHLNYPTTGQVFDQILAVLAQRGLTPVTVSELMAAGG